MRNRLFAILSLAPLFVMASCSSNSGTLGPMLSPLAGSNSIVTAANENAALSTPRMRGTLKQQVQYVVRDLGTLGGSGGTGATAEIISDNGWVVGTSTLSGDTTVHGFAWRRGRMTNLGSLGGLNSAEYGVPLSDGRGLIAGTSQISAIDPLGEYWGTFAFSCNNSGPCDGYQSLVRGFIWQDGIMTALPTLGGNNAKVNGINDNFQVVGFAEDSVRDLGCPAPQVLKVDAVMWQPGDNGGFSAHRLPLFAGDTAAEAAAINDRGQVAGVSGSCSGLYTGSQSRAVLWDRGAVIDMGNLGGLCCNTPVDINARGQVVGYAGAAGDTTFHAFRWQNGESMTDLGVLPGDAMSFAFGINDHGDIVGGSCADIFFNNCTAMIWQHGIGTDLNTLVKPGSTPLYLFFGNDINSRGEIAAFAFNPRNGEYRAALVMPCNDEHADIVDCEGNANDAQLPGLRHPLRDPQRVRQQFLRQTPFGRLGVVR